MSVGTWTRWKERVATLPPRTILLIGFGVFLLYAFPGYMSTDSTNQLLEARTGQFSNGNPPLMAAEWWVLDRIVCGPILMLLLQGSLFLGGLYCIFCRLLTPRQSAWTACAVLLFPPVLVTMAVIWKDSQMAAYLVAGTAALIQPRLRTRAIGLALLVGACGFRHNGFAAVMPLVCFLFEWRTRPSVLRRLAIVVAVMLAMGGAAFAVSRVLTVNRIPLTPVYQDIVGMIARTHDRTDEDLIRVLEGTPLVKKVGIQARARELHGQLGAYLITTGEDRLFNNPGGPAEWAALDHAWRELFEDDPLSYVTSHWDSFAVMIGLGDDPFVPAPIWNLFLEQPSTMHAVDHYASWSLAQVWIVQVLAWLYWYTPLYTPYIYAAVGLLLLALCSRDRLTAGLIVSGLLYELSFFPVGPNPDYRYSHWMITSIVIAAILLFIQRRRRA